MRPCCLGLDSLDDRDLHAYEVDLAQTTSFAWRNSQYNCVGFTVAAYALMVIAAEIRGGVLFITTMRVPVRVDVPVVAVFVNVVMMIIRVPTVAVIHGAKQAETDDRDTGR